MAKRIVKMHSSYSLPLYLVDNDIEALMALLIQYQRMDSVSCPTVEMKGIKSISDQNGSSNCTIRRVIVFHSSDIHTYQQ